MLSLTPDKQTLRQKPLWGIKKVTKYSKSLNSFSLEENILKKRVRMVVNSNTV